MKLHEIVRYTKSLRNSDVKISAYSSDNMQMTSTPRILFFHDLSFVHSTKIHFKSKWISFDWIEWRTLQIRNENSFV